MRISSITAGLDVGYGSVKCVVGPVGGPIAREVLLPAGALPARLAPKVSGAADLRGGEEVRLDRQVRLEDGSTRMESESWVAGVEPAEVDRAVRQMTASYPLTDEYLALYRAGLARMQEPKIDLLVTGLPTMQYYAPGAKELISAMIGRMAGVHQINATTTVEVGRVSVIPQPLGAFMGVATQPEHRNLMTGAVKSLVVDVGFWSTDVVTLVGRGVNESTSSSSLRATSTILELAAKALSERHEQTITRDDLDRALRRGEKTVQLSYTRHAEFMPFVKAAAAEVASEAVTQIRSLLRDVARLDLIILTGGGAFLYEEAVRAAWPKADVMLVSDPCFGNARGYRATAEVALATPRDARAA
jgi:plasmid segregation protein ParM